MSEQVDDIPDNDPDATGLNTHADAPSTESVIADSETGDTGTHVGGTGQEQTGS
ncbi:hypothetical protein NUM3379_23880 [Kineococcus sp. NUM-3379]